jgi:hypothetical protein
VIAGIESRFPLVIFEQVPIAELSAESDWEHGNTTGPAAMDIFDDNTSTTSSLLSEDTSAQSQCFNVRNTTVVAKIDWVNSSDRNRTKWRSDRKKKDTVSAALLIALGVA